MITYEDNGMYSIIVKDGYYKIGNILSFEGRIWWYKPLNGWPSKDFKSLGELKLAIKSGEIE